MYGVSRWMAAAFQLKLKGGEGWRFRGAAAS